MVSAVALMNFWFPLRIHYQTGQALELVSLAGSGFHHR
jgi:hypothetical protein